VDRSTGINELILDVAVRAKAGGKYSAALSSTAVGLYSTAIISELNGWALLAYTVLVTMLPEGGCQYQYTAFLF